MEERRYTEEELREIEEQIAREEAESKSGGAMDRDGFGLNLAGKPVGTPGGILSVFGATQVDQNTEEVVEDGQAKEVEVREDNDVEDVEEVSLDIVDNAIIESAAGAKPQEENACEARDDDNARHSQSLIGECIADLHEVDELFALLSDQSICEEERKNSMQRLLMLMRHMRWNRFDDGVSQTSISVDRIDKMRDLMNLFGLKESDLTFHI